MKYKLTGVKANCKTLPTLKFKKETFMPPTPSQHTKGPWKVVGDNYGNIEVHCDEPHYIICEIFEPTDSKYRSREEKIANARLIALAPRMFEFVKLFNETGGQMPPSLYIEARQILKDIDGENKACKNKI